MISQCPEAEYREGLSDPDFWAYVLTGVRPGEEVAEPEADDGDDEWYEEQVRLGVCGECGQVGACAYDAEGRAMIHVRPVNDD